jgi:hypothetical protein
LYFSNQISSLCLVQARAAIQRRGPILAWIVILSVYGADTIAIYLSLSALICWFMNSIIGFLNNSNLHALISTLVIINLHWVKKFILLYKKKFITMLISSFNPRNHSITRLISFTKQRYILSVYGPRLLGCLALSVKILT